MSPRATVTGLVAWCIVAATSLDAHAGADERDCEAAPAAADRTAPEAGASTTPTPDTGTASVPDADAAADPQTQPTTELPPDSAALGAGPDTPQVETPPDSAAAALGRTPRRVKCLDESMIDEFGRASVRKGVQPRDFRKAKRVVLSLFGGVRGGDLTDTQWQAGGSIGFWPFEAFGFDAEFRLTPVTLRIERAATSFTQENRFPDGVRRNLSYAAIGHLLFSPIHTKLRARGDRIVHGDFVLQGGAGAIIHDTVQAAAFDVGMSLYLFPASFLSVRFDLTDRIYAQEAIGSRRITNDLVFSAGLGFWIPPRRR